AEMADVPASLRLAHFAAELVRELYRGRHQLRRLVAGVTEHQSLIARAACINPHCDVRRLRVDGNNHAAGLGVETILGPRIADLPDGLTRHLAIVDLTVRRNL